VYFAMVTALPWQSVAVGVVTEEVCVKPRLTPPTVGWSTMLCASPTRGPMVPLQKAPLLPLLLPPQPERETPTGTAKNRMTNKERRRRCKKNLPAAAR